jgi:hypothetical protein
MERGRRLAARAFFVAAAMTFGLVAGFGVGGIVRRGGNLADGLEGLFVGALAGGVLGLVTSLGFARRLSSRSAVSLALVLAGGAGMVALALVVGTTYFGLW